MKFKEIERYAQILQKGKKKCKCGHSIIVPPHVDKVVCNWCGKYVFKNKKVEFEYRFRESMNKEIAEEK